MAGSEQAKQEVQSFEDNAKEGVRAVVFAWLLRKVLIPLTVVILLVVVAVFQNRAITGFTSALVFAVPLALILWFGSSQLKAIWS